MPNALVRKEFNLGTAYCMTMVSGMLAFVRETLVMAAPFRKLRRKLRVMFTPRRRSLNPRS